MGRFINLTGQKFGKLTVIERTKNISVINGKNTDLKIDNDVYDIEFELIKEQTNEE